MANSNEIRTVLSKVCSAQKAEVSRNLKTIYDDLSVDLNSVSESVWHLHVKNMESVKVSGYINDLQFEVKKAVCTACVAAGFVPSTGAQIMWADATADLPLPTVIPIVFEDAVSDEPASQGESVVPSGTPSPKPPTGKLLLIGGTVLEIVAWVFIPSSGVWAPIARGIGLILMAVGAYMVVREAKRCIEPNEDLKAQLRREAIAGIARVCDESRAANEKNIDNWIEKVCSSVEEYCLNNSSQN